MTSKERVRRLMREHGRHRVHAACVAERFVRTLTERLLWLQAFDTVEELMLRCSPSRARTARARLKPLRSTRQPWLSCPRWTLGVVQEPLRQYTSSD